MDVEALRIAEVIVDVPAMEINRPFDYLIPDEWLEEVQIGSRIRVPFGNRLVVGYCIGKKSKTSHAKLKAIDHVMDLIPPLTPELVELGKMMAEEYLCHPITALQSMVPAVLKGNYQKVIHLHPKSRELFPVFTLAEQTLYDTLKNRGECHWEEALTLPGVTETLLKSWLRKKRIWVEERVKDRVTKRKVTWVWGSDLEKLRYGLENVPPQAKRQKELLNFFLAHPEPLALPKLLSQIPTTRSTVQKLVEKGWLKWEEREEYRDPYRGREFKQTAPLPLTKEQQFAYQAIVQSMIKQQSETILLHGVTGSGKTEVYLQAIAKGLEKKREAIVLVPEISLTPQMVQRFKERFGDQVAVLHSRLSHGERYDEWRKIRRGEVQIVIGARSAIFAPLSNIGLIIIDEEHESSYKQEENPKYHAREIAQWRAKMHRATLVLGSATPSVESYYRARTGEYKWIQLKERVHGRPFPQVEVVDMRTELREGNRSMFSRSLLTSLQACMDRGEQAVLFLNRRGFATFVMCRECGETLICPHCDISLTYHQSNQTIRCHYCGYIERVPQICPHCQSRHIRHFGTGTQRVEEELLRQFPERKVIRMDIDTTRRKGSHERLLNQFRDQKADVLLGTQMIAKGLDFPNVTLVGVIAADTMLHLPDFRATERTFQLLMQVGGRAGRHERPGKVIIQTYHPDHYSIQLAATYQVENFYRQECAMRKKHLYPPFCGLVTVLISHLDRILLLKYSQQMEQYLRQHLAGTCQLLGPVPPTIPKLKDRYRLQMIIKFQEKREIILKVKKVLAQLHQMFDDKDLRLSIEQEISQFFKE